MRVSDYRIVYRIEAETNTVVIIAIKHRKEVYDDF
ncbi:TPA: type II toxin-antitoxin system RelE/ParE family toxin [Legionella pneumophila]